MTTRARATLRFGRPPDPNNAAYQDRPMALVKDMAVYLINVVDELERHSQVNDQPEQNAFTPTNVTVTRTYDADSTTTAELADVLGTVIAALQTKGVLS